MLARVTKHPRVWQNSSVTEEAAVDPLHGVRRHVNDYCVATVVDLSDKSRDSLARFHEDWIVVKYLADSVMTSHFIPICDRLCWWSDREVEPKMSLRELLKEVINLGCTYDVVYCADGTAL